MTWEFLQEDTNRLSPKILPAHWAEGHINQFLFAGRVFFDKFGLKVLVTVEIEEERQEKWLHVSVSRQDRIPNWEELKEVKDIFIGKKNKAIQVLPPEDEYVNLHPHVLHLWRKLGNKDWLPDFRKEGGL